MLERLCLKQLQETDVQAQCLACQKCSFEPGRSVGAVNTNFEYR